MRVLRMRFTSADILSTIGRGVPAGANSPCHEVASKPFSVSAIGGTSGAVEEGTCSAVHTHTHGFVH